MSILTRQVVEQQPNLTGAGGVVGHQFGKGNCNTAMTVLGAVAGAAAGIVETNLRISISKIFLKI